MECSLLLRLVAEFTPTLLSALTRISPFCQQEALDEIAAFEEFMSRFMVRHCEESEATTSIVVPQSQSMANLGSNLAPVKKKKNALRRLAAVHGEPTLQRQRPISSQESDEITPT